MEYDLSIIAEIMNDCNGLSARFCRNRPEDPKKIILS